MYKMNKSALWDYSRSTTVCVLRMLTLSIFNRYNTQLQHAGIQHILWVTIQHRGKTLQVCKNRRFQDQSLLRATATSRLYRSGIDEQLVMERTGHRSLEGVCSYKCTSDDQRKTLSDIFNRTETAPTIILQLKSKLMVIFCSHCQCCQQCAQC